MLLAVSNFSYIIQSFKLVISEQKELIGGFRGLSLTGQQITICLHKGAGS